MVINKYIKEYPSSKVISHFDMRYGQYVVDRCQFCHVDYLGNVGKRHKCSLHSREVTNKSLPLHRDILNDHFPSHDFK